MRYINKTNKCESWITFTKKYEARIRNKKWNKFTEFRDKNTKELVGRTAKRELQNFLFKNQKKLCIYCEQELEIENKENYHIEHLKPKSLFRELTYVYDNLALSCNGFICKNNFGEIKKKQFCGHFKNSKFKEENYKDELFLNPHEVKDLDSFFDFDIEGNILPNSLKSKDNQSTAKYMIEYLGLNNEKLVERRKNTYTELVVIAENEYKDAIQLLDFNNSSFISFHTMLCKLFGLK